MVERQAALEQQLGTLKENEVALYALQDSLCNLDQALTSYLTDRIDAFQKPQEAQVYTHTHIYAYTYLRPCPLHLRSYF